MADGFSGEPDPSTWIRVDALVTFLPGPLRPVTITATVVSVGGWYTNSLRLASPFEADFFACSDGAGTQMSAQSPVGTSFLGPTGMIWEVENQDGQFASGLEFPGLGPASTDGFWHFRVYQDVQDAYHFLYYLEDEAQLGDHDYDDCVFDVQVDA
jgi:hypothetical protein